MQAVVIERPGVVGVETVPDPAPGPGEVVVAPRAVGICGTDLHIIDGHFPPAPYPLIPGHELSGEVVAVGAGVEAALVGAAVVVDPSLFCGRCRYCRRQRGNLCEAWGAIGDTVAGGFAEYVAVPAANLYRFEEGLGWSAGALVEPLACVVHGIARLALAPGSDVLILGAGTIGLLLLQTALSSGAASVFVVDPEADRRALAAELGAAETGELVEALVEAHHGGFEYVIDATGVAAATEKGVAALCRGGTLLVFGVTPQDERLALSPFSVYNDEITIIGSMAVLSSFEPALNLVRSGRVAVERFVTHTFALGDFAAAVANVRARQGLKTQVLP